MSDSIIGQRLEECDSTNIEARRLIAERAPSGSWISARRQRSGRGRQGRAWVGVEGNLYLSVLIRPERRDRLTWVGLAAGLALARWVREVSGVDAKVKWPNDILVGGRKLAGILCESVGSVDGVSVIVGVGLNCAATPEVADRAVTSLARLTGGPGWDAREIDGEVALAILDAMEALDQDTGVSELRSQWERWSALPRGSWVSWGESQDAQSGEVLGLGEFGELRVMTAEGQKSLLAEDVHLRSAQ